MAGSCFTEGDDSKQVCSSLHVLPGGKIWRASYSHFGQGHAVLISYVAVALFPSGPYVPEKLELIGLSTFRGSCWVYVLPPRRLQVYLQPS